MIHDCAGESARAAALGAAVEALRAGGLVVTPTDTLYGIAADAFDDRAVAALLAAKRRGPEHPVPVLVGSWDTIQGLVDSHTPEMRALVEAFWPGGLSVVVPQAPSLPWKLGDTAGTVMLRMPLHPIALRLLRMTGPLAVSSANIHGHEPPTTALEAQRQLGESVAVYLDGGVAPVGRPSTIVDLASPEPRILRRGAVPAGDVAEVLGIAPGRLTRDA